MLSLYLVAFWTLPLLTTSCLLEDGRSAVYLSVFEDLKPGGLVGNLPIRGDVSEGASKGIKLRLVKGTEYVELRQSSKDLLLRKPLDRDEGAAKIEAVVECRMVDAQSDFSELNISVLVTVKDVNDNAPVFDQHEYRVNISEELPIGTIVFADFEAEDSDQSGPNSLVRYSILAGPHSEYLEITDPFRPLVTVKKRIDFEQPLQGFSVQIEARDQGIPAKWSVATLKATVIDIDDQPPRFDKDYYHSNQILDGELIMGSTSITAVDGDALKAKILYELSGELTEHFAIDPSGTVRLRSNPPPPLATLFIHAYQENNRDRNATAILYVDLLPTLQFEFDRYAAQIRSDAAPNTQITQVRAFARNEKSQIHYALNDSDALIAIDEKYGKVLFKGNYGDANKAKRSGSFSYTVLANDGKQTARTKLHVYISPDSPCHGGIRFEHDSYEMQLTSSSSVIGEVSLAPRSDPAMLKLLNLNRFFALDDLGRLSIIEGCTPPCDLCELIVTATDRQGRVALAKVLVHNTSSSLASNSFISILLLLAVVFLLCLLLFFVCRRINYASVEEESASTDSLTKTASCTKVELTASFSQRTKTPAACQTLHL